MANVECRCGEMVRIPGNKESARCPNCDRRVWRDDDDYDEPMLRRGVVTIQATAKIWKATQAIGALSLIGVTIWGCVGVQTAQANQGMDAAAGPVAAGFLALIVFMVGRVGAWWCHE